MQKSVENGHFWAKFGQKRPKKGQKSVKLLESKSGKPAARSPTFYLLVPGLD